MCEWDTDRRALNKEEKMERLAWAQRHSDGVDWWEESFMLSTSILVDLKGHGDNRKHNSLFALDIYLTAEMEMPGLALVRRADDMDSDFFPYFDSMKQTQILAGQFDLASVPHNNFTFTYDVNPISDLIPDLLGRFRQYLCNSHKAAGDTDEDIDDYVHFFKQAWRDIWFRDFKDVVLSEMPRRVKEVLGANGGYTERFWR